MVRALSAKPMRARLVAVSHAALTAAGTQIATRVPIVPDPVEVPAVRQQVSRRSPARVLAVANQQPTKGLDVIIDTILGCTFPLELVIFGSAGDADANDYVRAQHRRLVGYSGPVRVRFAGVIDSLAAALPEFDVAFISSRRESFSRVAAEALQTGVPLVAPAIPGLLDTVDGGRLAHMYAPGDSADALARILGVLSDYVAALELADVGVEWARRRFSCPVVGAAISSVYRSVLREGYSMDD